MSIRDRLISKHETPEALGALVGTINFIDIWLKILENSYDARRVAYITDMKENFNQIPITMMKSLTTKQKSQKLMTEICGGC